MKNFTNNSLAAFKKNQIFTFVGRIALVIFIFLSILSINKLNNLGAKYLSNIAFYLFTSLILIMLGYFYFFGFKLIKNLRFENIVLNHLVNTNTEFFVLFKADKSIISADKGFYDLFGLYNKNYISHVDFVLEGDLFTEKSKKLIRLMLEKINISNEVIDLEITPQYRNRFYAVSLKVIFPKFYGIESFSFKAPMTSHLFLIQVLKVNKYKIIDFELDLLNKLDIPAFVLEEAKLTLTNKAIENLITNFDELPEAVESGNLSKLIFTDENAYHIKYQLLLANQMDENTKIYIIKVNPEFGKNDIWPFLSNFSIPSLIVDNEYNIIQANQSFSDLIEVPIKKLLKSSMVNLFASPEYIKIIENSKKRKLNNYRFLPVEIKIKASDSGEKIVMLHVKSSEYMGKMHFIFSLIDTTMYKTLEANAAHSQKMQAIGQLSGAIAHDFNNLLTAMMGFADILLLRHPAGDRSFGDIMQIKQNVNRAANLVRQLLAFSRKQVMQPEIYDVTTIIAELSNLISRLIGGNIELRIEYGKDIDLVKVDQGQFEQVIINLAVNARDAMPQGGILTIITQNITIENENEMSADLIAPEGDERIIPGKYVFIEIKDTGTGIPNYIIPKIFEPFFSTKEIGAGTGLGLSTVYGVIKQTGGHIRLSTKENQGTSFYIYLKAVDDEDELREHRVEKLKEENIDKASASDFTGYGKILIVEDEDPIRIFSSQALANKGYEMLEAENAEVALSIIEREEGKIEVIITDVLMPGMNGPTMIEKVKEKYPNIKVIFISGYAEDAFSKTYALKDKFNFLAKPFTLKQLTAKVKEVLYN